jgi:hypothetical protein
MVPEAQIGGKNIAISGIIDPDLRCVPSINRKQKKDLRVLAHDFPGKCREETHLASGGQLSPLFPRCKILYALTICSR